MVSRFETPGLFASSKMISRPESVTAEVILRMLILGSSSSLSSPASAPSDLLILAVGLGQVLDLGDRLDDQRLRHHERLAEAAVEPHRKIAGQLEVLSLVLTDRHLVGLVDQDVCGHQDRVGEQPDARRSAPSLAALSLNWVIRLAWPKPVRQPRIQASWVCSGTWDWTKTVDFDGSTPAASSCAAPTQRLPFQLLGILLDGQRVQVRDPVEGLVIILQRHPLPQRPEEVAEMERVCAGLGEREHPGLRGHSRHGSMGTA